MTVRSDRPLAGPSLRVAGPDGALLAVTPGGANVAPPYIWDFIPQKAGEHSVALLAEGVATPLVQMTLTVRPKVWGLPREQYDRTYVLLPPDADSRWVRAILESSAWERRRWTIGGSADDAGIGALLSKTVIAINPTKWPGNLEAFFQQYYPGTRYVPLIAATPEELRRKLERM